MKLQIKRTKHEDKQTLGTMTVLDDNGKEVFKCSTLELAWKNNQPQQSCIPVGTYKVKKRTSTKYGNHFHVQDVPNRSFILIHHGNFHWDVLGCILVGTAHTDINADGYKDVVNSKVTMKKLLGLLPDTFQMVIS